MKNKHTKMLLACVCLILVLAAMPLVAACGEEAPVTPIKLVAASYLPPGNPIEEMLQTWGADFEERTDGRYTVEVISGGALAGLPESYDVLVTGVADISFFSPPMIEKPFPLTELPVLFWGPASAELMSEAWYESVYKEGYLDEELADVKVLMTFIGPVGDIETVNPINTLAELEGVKLANAQGPLCVELATRLGAISVLGGPPDMYLLLQGGTVEGMFGSAPMLEEFGCDEFVRYMLPIQISHMSHVVGMNWDVYNNMPDDVKDIVDDMAADEKYYLMAPRGWDVLYENALQYFFDGGGVKIEWSAADIAELNEIAGILWEEELVRLEAQGIPAREVCDALYNAMEELGATPAEIAFGYTPGS